MPGNEQSEAGNNTKRIALDSNIDTIAGLTAVIQQGFEKIENNREVIQKGFENIENRMTASENKFDKMINALKQEQTAKNNEHDLRFNHIEGQQTRIWDYIRLNNSVSDSFRSDLRKEIALAEKNLVLRGLNNDPTEQQVKDILAIVKCNEFEKIKLLKGRNKAKGMGIVTFKDNAEQNKVLFGPGSLKKDIPSGITLAQDVPERYRQKYIEFSKEARNTRTVTNSDAKERIYFNDIELVFALKGANGRTQKIDSYTPDSSCPAIGTDSTISCLEPGAPALRTVLMNVLPPNTDKDTLKANIIELVGADGAQIESVTVEKRSGFIVCSSPESAFKILNVLVIQKTGVTTNNVFLAGRKVKNRAVAVPGPNQVMMDQS